MDSPSWFERVVESGDDTQGNFQCWGVLLTWIIVGQEPTLPAVGAGGS